MEQQIEQGDQQMNLAEKKITPSLNRKALYSDTTESYCSPQNVRAGQSLAVRFRTEKNNVDKVYVVTRKRRVLMKKVYSRNGFDYYETYFSMTNQPFYYYFEVWNGVIREYYCKIGVTGYIEERYSFQVIPDFYVPDWAKGAVMYQIFVDRFCNGDKSNDVEDREYIYLKEGTRQVKDWHKYPDNMDVRSFYGGDLQGVLDKLDYLQMLGVEVIYFNPLFVSPSNHKYDSQDYDYIDPHIGKIVEDGGEVLAGDDCDNRHATKFIKRVTDKKNLEASNQFFVELVEEIHRRGMKVILDGVFNHCGSFNKWMDRERLYENAPGYEPGAYIDKHSPYREYFGFREENWPYNGEYDGWWGHETLPKLNYEESKELHDEIIRIGQKWVSPPYNVDGWRLDVAADLGHSASYNHEFWRDFRKAVREANPEALILAEHYGNPSSWLRGDQWDSVMNYDAFMEPVTWYLTGMQKHSDGFRGDLKNCVAYFQSAMRENMTAFTTNSLQVAMNELSNHDHSRFLTRTNGKVGRVDTLGAEAANEGINKGVFREAVVIQMTWPGAPTIYYGDEAGVCGFTDPDNRRTYPWGKEDFELIEFHRYAVKMHKKYEVLKTGSLEFLPCNQPILCYGRFNAKEQVIVAVNNFDYPMDVEIEAWYTGMPKDTIMTQIMATFHSTYSIGKLQHSVRDGKVKLQMKPESSVVLYHKE